MTTTELTGLTGMPPLHELPDVPASGVKLPRPVGYNMLVKLPKVETVTKGGIHKPDELIAKEETASMVVEVVAMGDQCYTGTTMAGHPKFPTGAWCAVGDFIIMRSYAGSRVKVNGEDYRIITDDMVQAIVDDPKTVERG